MSISIDKDGNTLKISRQSKDIFLKTLVDNFSNLLVSTLEIHKAQNISVLPNELPIIEVSKAIMDRVLLIDNKNILNIEFDTSGLEENLVRYMFYAAVISQAYYKKYNTYQAVYTAVIYPGFVKLPTNIYTTEGSLLFTVKQIYVPDYINPNEIYNETIHLIQSGENLSLHKQNLLNFLLSPYGMTNYDDCKKFCEDILKFSLKTPQICNNDHIFSLVAASTASIIGDTDFFKDQMRSNERMKEAIDFLSGGLLSEYEDTISKAKTEIAEAKAKVEVVEAKAKAEVAEAEAKVAEAEAKVAEAKVAEAEAKAAADKLKFQSQIVALKMKLKDIDLNFISECTGLSIEEINHI